MTDYDATLKVLRDPRAPERERDFAKKEFCDLLQAQAPTTMEIIEELTPQDERSRLPIKIGRRYFHSWKDTERLYAEVTAWTHFPLHHCPADTPPPDTQAAFEDVFADLIRESGAVLKLHPLYRRWTVFVRTPAFESGEMAYLPAVMIVDDGGQFGKVPADLQRDIDPRLHPIIAKLGIGPYKVPTRQDFENLRYKLADVRYLGGSRAAARKHARAELDHNNEYRKIRDDMIDDFIEHNGALYERDVNRKYGSMQGLPFVPGTSLEQFEKENPTHESTPALDAEGKPLGYSTRRKLKPFERGEQLGPYEKRMIAITAWRKRWEEDVAKAEAEGDRMQSMRLGFLDPGLGSDERDDLIRTAEKECPGIMEALFGALKPEEIIRTVIDDCEAKVDLLAEMGPAFADFEEKQRAEMKAARARKEGATLKVVI